MDLTTINRDENDLDNFHYFFFSYLLKDLWESEKEYVRELNFAMDTYFKAFEGKVPDELAGKRDIIFSTYPEIFSFHNE